MTLSQPPATDGIRYAEVIGDPVAHSRSPLIHRFWLDRLGIAADYRLAQVAPADLGAHVAARARDPLWAGSNVTLPHKVAVLGHAADPGDVKGTIGAANTLLPGPAPGDRPRAVNTDAAGFLAPIADVDWAGAPVVVAGTGGAAAAVLFALSLVGAGPVTLVARRPLAGAALLARFGLKGRVTGFAYALPPDAALLVNASSLGMVGQPGWAPDLGGLRADAVVYDCVYAPLDTPLLRAAEAAGLEAVDGLAMLMGQAALAFELFFGVAPPSDAEAEATLRDALVASLGATA